MLYRVHLIWAGFELTALVVIGTDYIGSCKSNYHTITSTTAPHTNQGQWLVLFFYKNEHIRTAEVHFDTILK